MKKFLNFQIYLFLSLVLFIIIPGCEKDDNPVVPPIVEELIFSVTPDPSEVEFGQSSLISIKTNADSTFTDIPEAKVFKGPFEKSVPTPALTQKTTYHIRFYKNGEVDILNPEITVKPKAEKPTLVLEATPKALPIGGGKVKISWTTTNTDQVFWNEIGYSSTGYIEVARMTETTTFVMEARNSSQTTVDSITVVVDQPTQDDIYFCTESWVAVEILRSYVSEDGPWEETGIDCTLPWMKDDLWTFYYFPERKMIYDEGLNSSGQITTPGTGPWSFNSDRSLNGIAPKRTVRFLDQDTMIWTYIAGSTMWTKVIHKHPSTLK